MKISIIGQGYVGLTVAVFAAEHHTVVGYDTNDALISNLKSGKSHIEGITDKRLSTLIDQGKYLPTSDPGLISDSDVVVIAVPTPLDQDRNPDLTYLQSACELVGKNLKRSALIINESTSFPGTVRKVIKPLVEKYSENKFSHLYSISPERVDPGRTDWDQRNTPRLYAGLTKEAAEATRTFYSSFCDNLVEVSTPEVAEAAKLFENTFRQVNIALVNEFAQIAHGLGISVHETISAAATKPYGFMKFNPSAGVGGHCIPVDPTYLSHVANEIGIPASFINLANKVNLDMGKYVVNRVKQDNGGTLKGKKVQIVGVAYKPNVSDTRETPAKIILDSLINEGAEVSWHDPLVPKWNKEESVPLGGSDIAIVVTFHDVMNSELVTSSAPYVFDTTGRLERAVGL